MLGAGDAFMGGFLRGWLRGEPHATSATWANACGAFAVSRLLCSPEYPTWIELQTFLEKGSPHHALRRDEALNHIHWATTRRAQPETLFALAIDHRAQLEKIADEAGAPRERIDAFKRLAVKAAVRVAGGRPGFGMLLDGTYGREALFDAAKHPLWIGRPVEQPGSRPLRFEDGADIGSRLIEWPVTQTVKCLAFYHPDDDAALKAEQLRTLRGLYDATRRLNRELLVEIIASRSMARSPTTRRRVRSANSTPPASSRTGGSSSRSPRPRRGARSSEVIAREDPWCRGVVLLGLEAPEKRAEGSLRRSPPDAPIVKGFAVGRTIFADARESLAGRDDRRRRERWTTWPSASSGSCALWENAARHEGGVRTEADGQSENQAKQQPDKQGADDPCHAGERRLDLCRLRPLPAEAGRERARRHQRPRGLPGARLRPRGDRRRRQVLRRARRAHEPVRGKALVGLRAGRRRLDGDGRDRRRACGLLRARRRRATTRRASSRRRTCIRRRAARARTSAM